MWWVGGCVGVCVLGVGESYWLCPSALSLPLLCFTSGVAAGGIQFVCVDMLEGSGYLSMYAPGLKCTNTHISVPRVVDDA